MLSTNNSGTDVVLSRFPEAGKDLKAFGLTPSAIKTIAIPNDIQEWPTSALNGCTGLTTITVYGDEGQTGELSITREYGLYDFAQLTSIQLPSTVTSIGDMSAKMEEPTFPRGLKSIHLSSRLTVIQNSAFYETSLETVDFSCCQNLQSMQAHAFREGSLLRSLDLSNCQSLTALMNATFFRCLSLTCVMLPPSLTRIDGHVFREDHGDAPPAVKTVIWKGRTTRPAIHETTGMSSSAFMLNKPLGTLVEEGTITEIFVP